MCCCAGREPWTGEYTDGRESMVVSTAATLGATPVTADMHSLSRPGIGRTHRYAASGDRRDIDAMRNGMGIPFTGDRDAARHFMKTLQAERHP